MKRKPDFLPPNYFSRKRIRNRASWRRPRGIDNKRGRIKARGPVPGKGWRTPKELRGLHPSGLPEVVVERPEQLEGLSNVVVRIAARVGKRKRQEIIKKADEKGLKILNRGGSNEGN